MISKSKFYFRPKEYVGGYPVVNLKLSESWPRALGPVSETLGHFSENMEKILKESIHNSRITKI